MKKYLQIIKGTWAEYMEYRLNFVLWRLRMVIQLLVIYFFWSAMFDSRESFAGYTGATMLTYITFTLIIRTVTMSSTVFELGNQIIHGTLSNQLVRPINIFAVVFARDIADKLMNVFFLCFEIGLFILLFQPQLAVQTKFEYVVFSVAAAAIGALIYSFVGILIGLIGFWAADVWAPRFLFYVILEFFTGMLFPLDIVSGALGLVLQHLPFAYFIFVPIKIYLGQWGVQTILTSLAFGLAWLVVLWWMIQILWAKGLRLYTAVGR